MRKALKPSEGDEIAYVIENGRVIMTRANVEAADDPFGVSTEWDSDADRRAYAEL